MPALRIDLLTPAAIPEAMLLKEAAGWNQTETDWRNVLVLAPEGCFGLRCEGRLPATTTAVTFGDELAWIGMVLTHPDYRGRGFARRLLEHALAYLAGRGVRAVKLDATDMGRPLYRKLGFADEQPIERWGRPADPPPLPPPVAPFSLDDWRAVDRAAFGADRSRLLAALAPLGAAALPGGYAMGRAGSRAAYFGPCVARHPEAACALLAWHLARHAGQPVYWDLLPANTEAVRLARACGFQPLRRLTRMGLPRGGALAHDDTAVFAIAGFEYG